jgi:hypothetical protein
MTKKSNRLYKCFVTAGPQRIEIDIFARNKKDAERRVENRGYLVWFVERWDYHYWKSIEEDSGEDDK